MNFFKTFQTFIQKPNKQQPTSEVKSSNSYELIVEDLMGGNEDVSDIFQELVFQEQINEEVQNMYIKDFIFVNRLEEPRELTNQEWFEMIETKNISLFPKKNIYFSIFKGLDFVVRKRVWQLFANIEEMKILGKMPYKELIDPQNISEEDLIQIDKDVPRSKSVTKFLPELRNLLIAYCAFTKKHYTQGMNLIAGSLLSLLALQNDQELQEFMVIEKEFQQRVFWVFMGVMVWKGWDLIFDNNFAGLTAKLKILQGLMIDHVPAIYQKIIDYEWDLTIFSQYYITIMLYNTPQEFSKIVLDLFLLDGENILHSLIIRMMKVNEDKILSILDECMLMMYFKKDMIMDTYEAVRKNQPQAQKLEDFEINFIQTIK